MKKIILLFAVIALPFTSFSQISLCNNAAPVCGNLTFANTTGVSSLGAISCVNLTPNPNWCIIKVGPSGNMVFNLHQGNNAPNYNNSDIDYVCWGPFNEIPNCTTQLYGYPSGNNSIPNNIIGCSYSASATETITIPNAITGKFYVILTTNFGGNSGTIVLTQTNASVPGSGSAECDYIVVNNAPADKPFQNNITFNVSALNVISYRWQMSTNGTSWTDLFDGGMNPTISGSASNSLNITDVPSSYIGNYFRVRLTSNTTTTNSTSARITGALQSDSFNEIANEILISSENITLGKLNGTLKIYDINGRILISKEITPNSIINISSFTKGIYILNFEDFNNHNSYKQKFIKN